MDFDEWLRSVCFQKPTPEAYDLAKAAFIQGQLVGQKSNKIYIPDPDFSAIPPKPIGPENEIIRTSLFSRFIDWACKDTDYTGYK